MLRLIIADDEKIIREAISNLIDWNAYGIDLIGTCKDGIETYNMIVDECPDIVMTDIKMPGLNGLDLIKKVYEIDPDIEFVILSGFSEFEFAKQAMEFGVRHYLLKPINENQIIDVMEKVKSDFYKNCSIKNLQYEKELLSNKFQMIIKKQFMIESLTCETGVEGLLEQYAGLFEFQHQSFAMYYISFLEERCLPDFVGILTALCEKHRFSICFNILYVKNSAVFILNYDQGAEVSAFDAGIKSLKMPGMTVEPFCQRFCFSNIKDLFRELIPNLKRYEKIFLIEQDKTQKEIYNYAAFFKQIDTISKSICMDCDTMEQTVARFFSTVDDTELAKTLASRLVVQTVVYANQRQTHNLSSFLKEVYGCSIVEDIVEITQRQIREFLTEKTIVCAQYKNYVEQALQYVNAHFGDFHLTLKWIAENYLFMNVNYLSKQFYKETGEKFSAFLNRVRMEKAKELIAEQGMTKVCQIAEQVGFGDNSQYFSQSFKKYTGFTPTEYIENTETGRDSIAFG